MVLFTTLKANKEHGIDELDIAVTYEECYSNLSDLFEEDSFDEVLENHTARQVASACLKALKADAKDKENNLLNWTTHRVFIDVDAPEIAFMQIEELIAMGVISCGADLIDVDKKARKMGCTIKKEVCYDEINHYYCMSYIDDIIEEKFPCYAKLNDTFCNNCGNCQ